MNKAIYPGSFDPFTNGHLDVLNRACEVFDEVIVLVAVNAAKKSTFSAKERVAILKEALADKKNVRVDAYEGLTVEYARAVGAKHIIRGLRAVMDFEYENQLASANRFLAPEVDMVFFMASPETSFISSSVVKELWKNGADITSLVPPAVKKAFDGKNY